MKIIETNRLILRNIEEKKLEYIVNKNYQKQGYV